MEKVEQPRISRVERLAGLLAVAGGILICFAAVLVTISVAGRRLFNKPVPGDYEMVEISVGIAVFAFLAYTAAKSGHIAVDTFTLKLRPRLTAVIDGVWDLVLAAFLGFFSWGLLAGGLNARAYGETLIQLAWPIWPVYLVCSLLAALACLVTLAVALLKIKGSP
ncbi:TRAP transporter small permease [Shinella curvata]|uniref:TRAP transporter small permease protein n=1 Tax=Shinella curvata TaxID=1817964 RepID=A0ABT8XMQ5_9HYPH|nr:TRAP transporter small permease [Shinella curvata]MCJ8057205.1 TRAP transporter small permease [Shinella curvata]MDO6125022.1 TRAP transporter small permease [Shinella curvata]